MTRADWTVVLLAVALLPMLYVKLWFSQGHGQQASIWVDGQVMEVLSLDDPRKLSVTGPLGVSVLEIRDHKIRFLDSPCRGKVCVHGGWLTEVGELLACLPNKVMVRILGSDPRFDAMNY